MGRGVSGRGVLGEKVWEVVERRMLTDLAGSEPVEGLQENAKRGIDAFGLRQFCFVEMPG